MNCNKWAYAKYHGLTMSELGKRGGTVSGAKRSKKKQFRERAEEIKERGLDWWNN